MSNPAETNAPGWAVMLSALAVLGSALFFPAADSAASQVVPSPPLPPPNHLVRELLEEDAQRALAGERLTNAVMGQRGASQVDAAMATSTEVAAGKVSPPASARPPVTSTARLIGIVGVGNKLSALVHVDGSEVIYHSGQALPASRIDPGLRLTKIAAPCADFVDQRKNAESGLTLCVNEAS